MGKELLNLALQDFPEGIVVVMACFALLKLRFDWKKIFILALLWALTNLVRLLPIFYGTHTIILLITISIYLRIFTRVKLTDIFKATTLCALIVLSLEKIYTEPLLRITQVPFELAVSTPVYRALFSLPYESVLLFLALLLNHRTKKVNGFILQDIPQETSKDYKKNLPLADKF